MPLRIAPACFAFCAALLSPVAAGVAAPASKPNVLFIVADDLRDWMNYLGHTQAKTPNFDRLARMGVSFTRSCTPAVTTYKFGNHAVRSERWRYIRYEDGGEELYDHDADPLEWKNLADDAKFDGVKAEHARWLPKNNRPARGHA